MENICLHKAYKFRIYPTPVQEQIFVQYAGCRRFVWNWALDRKQAAYRGTGEKINHNDLCAELTLLKKQPETAFLSQCSAQMLQQTLRDLDKAFVAFFEKRAGYPRFKARKNTPHAFRFPEYARIKEGSVSLPKIGKVKAKIHREAEGVLKSATIKQESGGAWYAVFVAHVEIPNVAPTCDRPVGIDVGLESFVTLSTGEKVKPPKFYRKAERKVGRLSRQLARCEKQSKRRQKAKMRLARFHRRIANRRNDWLHKLSARIVAEHDTVCIEDLNIKGLTRTKLAKSFNDAAIGEFLRQVEYKAGWHSGQVVKVGRFFPSSKICHVCESRVVRLTLSDRDWLCSSCGAIHDRDGNAAENILIEGKRILAEGTSESLNALGADVSPATAGNLR